MAIYKRGVTNEEDGQDPTITDCLKLKFKPVFVVHGCTVELTICKDNMTFMPDGRSFKFNQPIDYTFPTTSPCAGSRFIIPANTVINYNPKNKSANGFFTGVWGYGMALNIDLPINIFGGGTETVSATLESVITISNISLMPKLAEWHIYGNDQQGRFVTRKPEAEPLYYLDNLTNDVKNKNFFRILDKKEYELKDHLGNVRVAIGDMKLPADPTATYPARGAGPFFVDEKAINEYYPYGMTIADRSWSSTNYRYGYNTQEKSLELDPYGNHTTAEFWEYDARSGRRWNLDPVDQFSVSNYATFVNNPIFFNDISGDCPECKDGKYEIKQGDNFSTLEKKWGFEQGVLQDLNPNLNPKKLQIGSKINTEPDIPVNKPFTQTTTTTTNTTIEQKQPRSLASAATFALGASAADGPIPIGEAVGATVLIVAAIYMAATPTPTVTISVPKTTTTNSQSPFYYATYTKTNYLTGQVYVGRTSGYGTPAQIVAARDVDHQMDLKGYAKAVPSTSAPATVAGGYGNRLLDPSYWAIRGSEQLQIEKYRRLGISGNTYNGISPTNKRLIPFIQEALKLFH